MPILATDIMPITAARTRLTEIAAEVVSSGQPKILTRNGKSYVAVVGVEDLDELGRLRAAEHTRNLRLIGRGIRELDSAGGLSVEAFRLRAEALAARVARQPVRALPTRGKTGRRVKK